MTTVALVSSAVPLLALGLVWSSKNVTNLIVKLVLFGAGVLDVIALVQP